jgi:tRNA pseudouridine55 synthase
MATMRMKKTTRGTDGLLLVDKPAGVTSHDVVLLARRATGEWRIGHGGTLDPFATGLLVLLLGRATRLLPYLDGEPKVYRATVRFGAETETEDLHGAVTRSAPAPAHDAVLAALPRLTGEIDQVPPAYSAKRVDGRRAYDAARAGQAVELAPVRIRVDAWEPLGWDGDDLDVRITCGGGTYVRSLARDLGRLVGSAAHLVALRRERSGPFSVDDAASVEQLKAGDASVLPPLRALAGMAQEAIDGEAVRRIVRGIDVPASVPGSFGALVSGDNGALVAVAERRGERWQPRVVMREAE